MSDSSYQSPADDSDLTVAGSAEQYYFKRWNEEHALRRTAPTLSSTSTSASPFVDADREACLEGLCETGNNLEPTGTARLVSEQSDDHVITLGALRHVLLNMHAQYIVDLYPFVHRRLREYVTLEERKRLISLLNMINAHAVDTLPHYLGCMRMQRDSTSIFTVASGGRIPLMRMIFWVCDNSEVNFLADEAVLCELSDTARLKSIAALRYRFTVENKCKTSGCVNSHHYKRVNNLTTTVDDARRLAENDDAHFDLLADHWADTQALAEFEQFRQFTSDCSEQWVLAERALSRDGYMMSPIEAGLNGLSFDDDDDESAFLLPPAPPRASVSSSSSSSGLSGARANDDDVPDSSRSWSQGALKRAVVIPLDLPLKSKKRKSRASEQRVLGETVQ